MTPEEYSVIRDLGFDDAMLVYGDIWDTQHWPTIGDLGKFDRFFLLVWLLNRPDAARGWIFDRCRELDAAPDDHIDLWAREHYKMLCNTTPVLTANRGWVAHGDLVIGDMVYSPSGAPVRVTWVSPVYTDGDCYRVLFSDGAEIIAGGRHLWRLRHKIRRRVSGSAVRRIEWRHEVVSTTDLAQMAGRRDVGVTEPLEMPVVQLPVDPYVLGAWLGDGTSSSGTITCAYTDHEIIERIRLKGVTADERVSSNANSGLYRLGGMTSALRRMGLINNKHIPDEYLRASVYQRRELLRGLMDTDGHCNSRGTATFINMNGHLAAQVCELAVGLGLRAQLRSHLALYRDKRIKVWRVSFQAHKDRNPFSLKRKADLAIARYLHRGTRFVKLVEPVAPVPCRCITVENPDGMYLAGRSMVPTHNSSAGTLAGIIQEVVRDPEITIGIFSFNNASAKAFLKQIKNEFEGNRRLHMAYPGVFYDNPERESPSWSEDRGLVVRRKSNPKEPTVDAHGLVDGMPTGMHYQLRVYDDVVTEKSVTTPDMLTKTFDAWALSLFLGKEGGRQWHFGTRYHFGDAYGRILETGSVKERIYPATHDGTPSGRPVLFSQQYLDQKRVAGSYIFSCQMLQNPIADEAQGFKREWLKYWAGSDGSGMNRYILVDPANERKKNSDYTAAFVIGLGEDRNYYVLDMVRDRLNLTGRADMLFDLHKRWKPHGVGYERYGKDSDIQHYEDRMERDNYRFSITELGGRTSKNDRIRKLVPLFEQGRIYMPEACFRMSAGKNTDIMRVFIEQEYLAFPAGVHDDMLDCLARILEPDMNVHAPQSSAPKERDGYETKRKRSGSWMAA